LNKSKPDLKHDADSAAPRLAVLIDAENAQASVIDGLLAEVARFGEATVKRIYGDFTSPSSASWKKVLQRHAIKPVQQFSYTTGKNSSDSMLIIDAMDLLYTRRFDGFCLVSSDSDFTGLATRLREEGLTVLGFGEQKTPESFRNACHKFLFTEVLRRTDQTDLAAFARGHQPAEARIAAGIASKPVPESFPSALLVEALEQSSDDQGWAQLGTFGSYLNKRQPDFDCRLFGYKKLSELVKDRVDLFVTEERQVPDSLHRVLYLRGAAGKYPKR
jgi:hypothetical protein